MESSAWRRRAPRCKVKEKDKQDEGGAADKELDRGKLALEP